MCCRLSPLLLLLASLSIVSFALAQELPTVPAATEESQAPVLVEDTPEDSRIRERIEAVLGQIDSMDRVAAKVTAGVATLTGEVDNARAAKEVLDLVRRTEGVVYVQDQLDEEVEVGARLRPATRKFAELGNDALRLLPLALVALSVAMIFWFFGRWLGNREGWLRKVGLSELAANLWRRIIRMLVTIGGILIALEILDATALVGALLGVAGVAGIALGFAFRNIVENYLAGVLLSARNPFKSGDLIQVGEFMGKVVRLTSRDTVLMTLEGNHLRIPNSVIITSAMTNFSRNPLRRLEFRVGVATDVDLMVAKNVGMAAMLAMKGILAEPGPQVLVAELGDSAVQLQIFAWIDQRETDWIKARSEAIRIIKGAFDSEGIEMPEPIYRVNLKEPTAAESAEPRPPAPAPATEHTDVATDLTIEKQVAADLHHSNEENLLDVDPDTTRGL